jgi:hypothetical protein
MHGSDKKDPILDDALDALEDQLDGMPSLPDSADANSMSDDDLPSEDGIMQSGDDDDFIGQVDDDLDAMLDDPITTLKQDVSDENFDSDKKNRVPDFDASLDEEDADPASAPVDKMEVDGFDDFLDGDEPKPASAPVDKMEADDFDDFLNGDEPTPLVAPVDNVESGGFDDRGLSRLDGDDVGIPPIPDDGGGSLEDLRGDESVPDTIDNEVVKVHLDEESVTNDSMNDNVVKDPLDDLLGEDIEPDLIDNFIGDEDVSKDPLDDLLGEDIEPDLIDDFIGDEDMSKDPLDELLDDDATAPETDIDELLATDEDKDADNDDDWSNDMGLDELLVSGDNQGVLSDEDAISEFGEDEKYGKDDYHESSKDDSDEVADLLSSLERRSKAIIEKPSPKPDDTLNMITEESETGSASKVSDEKNESQATVGNESSNMESKSDKPFKERTTAKTIGLWVMGGFIVVSLVFFGALTGVYATKIVPMITGESVESDDFSEIDRRVLELSSRLNTVNSKVNDVVSRGDEENIIKRYDELFSTQQAMFKEQERNRELMGQLRSQLNDYEAKMLSRFEKVVTLASSVAKQQQEQSQDIKDTVLREALAIMKAQDSAVGTDGVESLQQNLDDSNRRLSQLQAQVLAQRNLMSLIETEVDYVKTRVSNDSQFNQSSPAYESVDLDISSPNRDVTVFVDTATPAPVKQINPKPLKVAAIELSLVGVFARGAGKFDIYVQDTAQGNGTSGVKSYIYSPNQVSNIKGYGRVLAVRKLDRPDLRVPYAIDTEGGVITGKR